MAVAVHEANLHDSKGAPKVIEKLEYKGKWAFWQHTDCGKVSGIQGFVDCNIFNGTLADLMQFTLPEPE